MEFQGTLYRWIGQEYAEDPYSGQGAALYGGRFNAKGVNALYTSTDPETILFEASQTGNIFPPSTLLTYYAHYSNLFDSAVDATPEERAVLFGSETWREEMERTGISKSQALASQIMDRDYDGTHLRYSPSIARISSRNVSNASSSATP